MQIPLTRSRIEIIDILRGFTLLGIIIIHFAEQYYAGMHPQAHANFNIKFLGDDIMQGIIGVFISGKFFAIFSFLFGLSFFLQLDSSKGGAAFSLRFLWRLIILLAIGTVHHLHYRGDILTIYAMLGVGLLIFFRLPDKALLILAIFLTLNIPSVITRCINAMQATEQTTPPPAPPADAVDNNQVYYDIIKSGHYVELLKANWKEFEFKYRFQVESGRIYITLGLFLLGLYAGRKKVFENLTDNLPLFRKLLKGSAWSILGVVLFVLTLFGGFHLSGIVLPQALQWAIGGFAFDAFNIALAVIYVSAIVLLFQKEKWKNRLMKLYEVGRMGLTTYLMQTFFGVLIFFGIGLNLLGEIGSLASAGIALVIFVLQIYFSKWWLARFKYGPVEWLWRSLTYLKVQPIKIDRSST